MEHIHPKANDGGPAFPAQSFTGPYAHEFFPGLTLRDWFAGMALQGLLSCPDPLLPRTEADSAYAYADAMLARRED